MEKLVTGTEVTVLQVVLIILTELLMKLTNKVNQFQLILVVFRSRQNILANPYSTLYLHSEICPI